MTRTAILILALLVTTGVRSSEPTIKLPCPEGTYSDWCTITDAPMCSYNGTDFVLPEGVAECRIPWHADGPTSQPLDGHGTPGMGYENGISHPATEDDVRRALDSVSGPIPPGTTATTTFPTPVKSTSWHLLTVSYGGTVSLIKGLSESECLASQDKLLGKASNEWAHSSGIKTAECFE
jgi:hypothetical protein